MVAGIYKKASFSLGGFHQYTDGFRINNDQKDSIGNAFLQLELSPQTSIQTEYRYRNNKIGDLQLNFFPDDVLPNLRRTAETQTYRAGLRHATSPASIFLGSFIYQRRDTTLHDEPDPSFLPLFEAKSPTKAISGELQHLFRSRYVNITSGIGHFNIESKDKLLTLLIFDPLDPPVAINETLDQDVNHTNVYLYSYINALKDVTFTIGASGDFYNTDSPGSESKNQFNPKFGVTWNPLPATTVRAAALRAFKRTLITNQTLEPTQVAGFNQFFDDLNSTKSWRYGAAIDQKFSASIFGGVEFSTRDVGMPFVPPRPPSIAATVRNIWVVPIFSGHLINGCHSVRSISMSDSEMMKTSPFFQETRHASSPLGLKFFSSFGIECLSESDLFQPKR